MDASDLSYAAELLYFRMNLLLAEITMQGMIAENKMREVRGESPAYSEQQFIELIDYWGIYHNAFPFRKG